MERVAGDTEDAPGGKRSRAAAGESGEPRPSRLRRHDAVGEAEVVHEGADVPALRRVALRPGVDDDPVQGDPADHAPQGL